RGRTRGGGDDDRLVRDGVEHVGAEERPHDSGERCLFVDLAGQAVLERLVPVEPPAGQLPLASGVVREDDALTHPDDRFHRDRPAHTQISITILPTRSPAAIAAIPSRTEASGRMRSMWGRSPLAGRKAIRSVSSDFVPIVEPTTDSWRK